MSNGPAIVIEGTREDWPGGPRTLTPLEPSQEANRQTTWFGAELAPDDNQVRFRITFKAIREMPENTPQSRGARLVERLIAWLNEDPERQLEDRNNFQVRVSKGETRIDPWSG